MKKLLFIFSLSFLVLFSCSSGGDDDNSENSCSTFLECYDTTDWKWEDGHGYLIYYRINNTANNPFTVYYYNDYEFAQPCLQVIPISGFNFNITENSKNKLVVHQNVSSGDFAFYTFELNSGVMSLNVVEYEDNAIVHDDLFILFEESVNESNIPICN
jgi:hypothetical protein